MGLGGGLGLWQMERWLGELERGLGEAGKGGQAGAGLRQGTFTGIDWNGGLGAAYRLGRVTDGRNEGGGAAMVEGISIDGARFGSVKGAGEMARQRRWWPEAGDEALGMAAVAVGCWRRWAVVAAGDVRG
ncbi:unnamed protein product [Cuscuta europaea]|uniref:Uncharacterized protein n=1 Tax=Cuscuta europaea TaxID=41803 RepID=A0A9P1EAY1_CUSEU|nr:unnamed protein product [Cuscuta europaea]